MSLRDSISILRARVAEHHDLLPGAPAFVAVVCDRCGCKGMAISRDRMSVEEFNAFAESVFENWSLGEYGERKDFCPRCK